MRHRVAVKVFGRRREQRKALFRGLATSLLNEERIETTLAKAKELRKFVEPIITLGKRGDLHARRQAIALIYKNEVVQKLFGEIAERYKDRFGGYTRIYRTGHRRGDGAPTAIIELIPGEKTAKKAPKEPAKKTEAKAEKPAKKVEKKPAKKEVKTSEKPKAKKKSEKKS